MMMMSGDGNVMETENPSCMHLVLACLDLDPGAAAPVRLWFRNSSAMARTGLFSDTCRRHLRINSSTSGN